MIFEKWGLIDYKEALQRQLSLVENIAQGSRQETIVFCSHPAVVTLGRGTRPGDLDGWSGATVEVSRGGRATYHGPSQLVVYPLLNLSEPKKYGSPRDLHHYLRALEAWTISGLSQHIKTTMQETASTQFMAGGDEAKQGDLWRTGVWVGSKKLASIGIAIKKWISYHGIAINLTHDPEAFQGIQACGYESEIMTSLEALIGHKINSDHLARALEIAASDYF